MAANENLVKEFVTAEQPLEGMSNAAFGSVAVILRNGRVARVVMPGKRFGRGWHAPWTGNLSVVQVNTGLVGFTMDVPTIPTSDQYTIQSVRIAVEVALNSSDSYEAFRRMVDRVGPTFGRGLASETENGVEMLVRGRLGSRTHHELYGNALAGVLGAHQTPFPIDDDGVLNLMHLAVEAVTWDPIYGETRETDARSTLVAAQTKVETAQARQDAVVQEARLDALQPLADQLGVSAWMLADPDRRREVEGRAFELAMTLLKPENRGLVQRNPGLMEAIYTFLPSMAPAGAHRERAGVDGARPAGSLPAALTVGDGCEPAQPRPDGPPVELTVDQRLARAWRRMPLPAHELHGLAGASVDGRGTVVAVTDPPVTAAELTDAPSLLAPMLRAESVRVMSLPAGDLDGLVGAWVRGVLGVDDAEGVHVTVRETRQDATDVLVVGIDGPQPREVVETLTDPDDAAHAALEMVLPYALVDVRLAES